MHCGVVIIIIIMGRLMVSIIEKKRNGAFSYTFYECIKFFRLVCSIRVDNCANHSAKIAWTKRMRM